jgi:hypothetical protein
VSEQRISVHCLGARALKEVSWRFRYFWAADGQKLSTQSGVFRTNCIDCLDRTNVVQSAFGRQTLHRHLVRLGIATPDELKGNEALDLVFNNRQLCFVYVFSTDRL